MRVHGVVNDVPIAGAHDHVCWVYRDDSDLVAAAVEFLAGGLLRGERLLCVGDRVVDGLRRAPTALGDLDELIADGRLRLLTVADAYAATGPFSTEGQHAFYDAATRRAVADGHTGLRVFADVTALAADAALRPELVRWEHVADEFIAHGPGMTAMCAYREDLPAATLGDLAGVHPQVHAPTGTAPFQVFFDEQGPSLTGDVDTVGAERLARILAATPVSGGTCAVDLSGLSFADVAACRVLARWARTLGERGVRLEFWNAPALLERMWHVLALDEWADVAFDATTPQD
ncbi:MEDS domain-containing protein [Blastococcus saxobsidens]|uniref:STAS domain-containing protein n=1 Tax=Blastococcus saxobsidens TaxID=138336 RepID=A0A4V2G269_9ACTN|nr:MEDS domain-containing protein [Blastococcus saxobsidens]RZU31986.1 STAS domain-containing protein [Blastococcus saxobsidens]